MSKAGKKREERAKMQAWMRSIGIRIARLVVLLVVGAILLVAFLIAGDRDEEISVDEAAAKRDQGAFILDVRTPEEWEEYHIPDSTLIPLDELKARLDEVPSDQEVVVVCRSGNRSQQGRDILKSAGFTQVSSMAGGVTEWQSQGYPTETGP